MYYTFIHIICTTYVVCILTYNQLNGFHPQVASIRRVANRNIFIVHSVEQKTRQKWFHFFHSLSFSLVFSFSACLWAICTVLNAFRTFIGCRTIQNIYLNYLWMHIASCDKRFQSCLCLDPDLLCPPNKQRINACFVCGICQFEIGGLWCRCNTRASWSVDVRVHCNLYECFNIHIRNDRENVVCVCERVCDLRKLRLNGKKREYDMFDFFHKTTKNYKCKVCENVLDSLFQLPE